jgi:hypothetical protein
VPKLAAPKKVAKPLPATARLKLGQALKQRKTTERSEPLWSGPESNASNGGITQSLLSRFLVCRERFRLLVVEGIREADTFNHRTEYGTMWHICEEHLANGSDRGWEEHLKAYCKQLAGKYRTSGAEIEKWYNVCRVQFPLYVKRWQHHEDVQNRKPIFQEKVFKVSYRLPSGRIVYLRGKFDAVDFIGKGLWIQENKSKGEVDRDKIRRELPFDLQSNFYLTALKEHIKEAISPEFRTNKSLSAPVQGIRYNVVKRPLSGRGEGNIRQRVGRGKAKTGAETDAEFYARLGKVISENPDEFFFRFNMEVSPRELASFQQRCLNPVLEQLCTWWASILGSPFDPWYINGNKDTPNRDHFMMPYGIWSPILEGRTGPLDEYINNGDETGLTRTNKLFTELT